MNDNTIVATVLIVVLAAMAIGGTYVYNLRAKMRQEMTIVRVESQKRRMHQLRAASAAVVRARRASRGQSRGRSRARSRRRDVSSGYDRRAVVDRDQNRNQQNTGNKGKKEQEQKQKQEQQRQKQDGDTRSMRSSGRKAPPGSRSGSKMPAQRKWESNGATNTTEQRPQEWDNQSNNSNDWEQYNNTDKSQSTTGYNQAENNGSKDDRDNKSECFDWNSGSKDQTNDNNNGGGQKGGWSLEASDAMATQKTAPKPALLPALPPSSQPAASQPDERNNEDLW